MCRETECKELVCQVGYAPETVSSYGAPSGDCCPQQGRMLANELTVLKKFLLKSNGYKGCVKKTSTFVFS